MSPLETRVLREMLGCPTRLGFRIGAALTAFAAWAESPAARRIHVVFFPFPHCVGFILGPYLYPAADGLAFLYEHEFGVTPT